MQVLRARSDQVEVAVIWFASEVIDNAPFRSQFADTIPLLSSTFCITLKFIMSFLPYCSLNGRTANKSACGNCKRTYSQQAGLGYLIQTTRAYELFTVREWCKREIITAKLI